MEEYSNRRSKTEIGFLRRGSRIPWRNRSPEETTNHNSDGPGSSVRLNYMKTGTADNHERPRYLHDPFKSSSSKAMPASSSKFPLGKFEEKRRQSMFVGVDIAESSGRRKPEVKHLEGSKKIVAEDDISDAPQTETEDFATEESQLLAPDPLVSLSAGSSGISVHRVESFARSASLSSRTHKQKDKEVKLGTPGACSSSFPNRPTIPCNSAIGVKPSYGHVSRVQRHGLKNIASASVPDVQPSGCPSDSVHNRRFEAMRKRASDGESSSRSRSLSGPSNLGHSPTYLRDTGSQIRTRDLSLSQQIIRSSSRNSQDLAVSVRTRRSSPQDTRFRVSEEREDGMLSLHDSSTRNQQSDQSHFSFTEISPESSIRPFSVELPHELYSSSRHGSNTQTARRRSGSLFEESPPQISHGPLRERGSQRRMTMEGIAEVLQALERIEQEAELTYEQLMVLETNLFLGAFATLDQHRDMRMDIDNMSYEELLALEERIGSVSTALSEEQFVKCLRRDRYRPGAAAGNKSIVDDIKCSICQEDYMDGEEVGRLPCEHQYHVCCIHQWLRQKNWCPVCKASAVPSMK
ncbi:uncharacterized protein LOC133922664 [Phragmites australis]|uniref:uncharacterized protein LOC133922664 n=1 Tax=Phragmites australis TaxID=29695 RepID=UPI002D776C9A|nr:uncharacterized protein LOC133922664 [Phragmites australis]XP_062224064.1 uncharacterized protein LOC133922664 [Phragmites australis]